MRVYLLLIFTLVLAASGYGQNLGKERSSGVYTYIYRISAAQACSLLQDKPCSKPFTDFLLPFAATPVDSFSSDSVYERTLPSGHYLFVKADKKNLVATYRCVTHIDADVLPDFGRSKLMVYHPDGTPLTDAMVKAGHRNIAFDLTAGAYLVRYRGFSKFISIQTPGDTLFFKMNNANEQHHVYADASERWDAFWRKVVRRFNSIKYRSTWAFKRMVASKARGYMVFNKPKYLPGDTVKLKAFITNRFGHPLKKPLDVKLYEGYYSYRDDDEWKVISKKMSPVTPGAWVLEFIVADSFKMDSRYQVGFSRPGKKHTLLYGEFRTEDYLLKVDRYTAKIDKAEYLKNDTLHITAGGTDFNGLPVMDGTIRVTGLTRRVLQYNAPVVFVPDTLFKLSGELDASGKVSFRVPASVFPEANLDAELKFSLSSSNHETWDTTIDFSFFSSQHRVHTRQSADTIYADYLVNGLSAKGSGNMMYYRVSDTDVIANIPVAYPYFTTIKPQAAKYVFTADHDSIRDVLQIDSKDGVTCYAGRTDSTALFYVVNSNKVPLHYSIYRNAAVAEKGVALGLNKIIPDKTNSVYTITLQYEWGGGSKVQNLRCEKMKDMLKIDLFGKDDIYPGEQDTMHVHVKDFYNRPVNKANLTAFSVNAQFNQDIKEPQLPGWHRYRRIHRKMFRCYLSRPDYLAELPLYKHPDWQARMKLQALPYYQMIFPQKMFATYTDSLPYISPQLGLYIYKNGKQIKIYSVHIDEVLVYTERNQFYTPYSFNVREGLHDIRVRTADREWNFNKTRFSPGQKLELSCNYDSLLRILPKPNRKRQYSAREISELRNHTFAISGKQNSSQSFYLAQGNRVFTSTGEHYKDLVVGPVRQDSVMFCHDAPYYRKGDYDYTVPFMPESGYAYRFRSGTTIMQDYDPYKDKIKLNDNFEYKEHPFGELALYPEPKAKPRPAEPEKYFINSRKYSTVPGTGRLLLNMLTDTDFQYINLTSATANLMYNADLRTRYPRYGEDDEYEEQILYSRKRSGRAGSTADSKYLQDMLSVPTGVYRVTAITHDGNYAVLGKVLVRPDGINYDEWKVKQFFKLFDFERLKSLSLSEVPEMRSIPIDTNVSQSGIAGKVYDEAGDPIPFAQIWVRRNDTAMATLRANLYGEFFYPAELNETLTLKMEARYHDTASVKMVEVKKGMVTLLKVKLTRTVVMNESGEVLITASKYEHKLSEQTVSMSVMSSDIIGRNSLGVNAANNISDITSKIAGVNALNEVVVTTPVKRQRMYAPSFGWSAGAADKGGFEPETYYISAGGRADNADTTMSERELTGKYAGAKSLRTDFKDYGFWQPNLLTDKDGNASFGVQYPDNLTSWKTYVLAMSRKRQSGMEVKTVRSFKELTASLAAPQFLIEGDSASATGKLFNYTNGTFTGTMTYNLNGNEILKKEVSLKNAFIQPVPLIAPHTIAAASDTLRAGFGFALPGGYADGEERLIPVFKKGTMETKGQFWPLVKDTAFTFIPETGMGNVTIHAEDDLLKVLLSEIKNLDDYPYWCTEQTASKLIALCMEQKIDSALGLRFKHDKEKRNIIDKLHKLQGYNGGWSWWQYSPNVHMTNYVLSALYMAERYPDYAVTRNAVEFLRDAYPTMTTEEQLSTLQTLALNQDQRDFVKQNLPAIYFDSLTVEQQLRYIKAGLQCGLDSNKLWQRVLAKKSTTMFGGAYWGNETYNFINNSMSATLTAYQIAGIKKDEALKQQIITYILTNRSPSGWRSTFESAQILSTILPDLVKQRGRNFEPPVLRVDGKEVTTYPYTTKTDNTGAVQISKTGSAPLYVTAYQQFFNTLPEPVKDIYEVSTAFEKGNTPVQQLKAGEMTTLTVTVHAKKYGEYIGIEVPIPAGCAYGRKDFPYYNNEVHREYFKNKVVIFCDKLPVGTSTFHILLEPRYTGIYTLNPARVELMYFPVFYGRNGVGEVRITE